MDFQIIRTDTFRHDFINAFIYIKDVLKNDKAANNLRDQLIKSSTNLQTIAAACKRLKINSEREYRIFYCGNYVIVFSIEDKLVVLHRFLYAKSDIYNRLKDKTDE